MTLWDTALGHETTVRVVFATSFVKNIRILKDSLSYPLHIPRHPQGLSLARHRTRGKNNVQPIHVYVPDSQGLLLTDEEFWVEQRRFVLRHLREFGFGKRTMAELVQEEAMQLVDDFRAQISRPGGDGRGAVFSMRDAFSVGVLNTLWSMMASRRYEPDDKELKDLQALLTELFANIDMVGTLFSQFPFLRYVAPEASGYRSFVNIHQRVWAFLRAELDNHKETFVLNQPRDLMDVYLQMLHSDDKKDSYSGGYTSGRNAKIAFTLSLIIFLKKCVISFLSYNVFRISAISYLHGHVYGWI